MIVGKLKKINKKLDCVDNQWVSGLHVGQCIPPSPLVLPMQTVYLHATKASSTTNGNQNAYDTKVWSLAYRCCIRVQMFVYRD